MKDRIEQIFKESMAVKQETLEHNADAIAAIVRETVDVLKGGGKLIFFGNGGSAADSQHIAAEFIGRFKKERRALAAMALTTDTSILTALSNDYGQDIIFSRQIEGLGRKGDLVFGITTSGNSKNVIEGIKQAKSMGIRTVALTGNGGGQIARLADLSIVVGSKNTARIQESHICLAHIICELAEEHF